MLVLLGGFLWGQFEQTEKLAAAPTANITRDLVPETDDVHYLGTTTPSNKRYKAVFSDITVSSCTGCGGGGTSFGQAFEITTNIFGQSSLKATSTATHNFIVDATGTSTFAGGIEAWRQITSPYFQATSTTATSTLKDLSFVDGQATSLSLSGNINFAGITAAGVVSNANLANSTISGIALGLNLADLSATNGTLTFSGNYNGGTARTVGLNLGNFNTWTAHQIYSSTFATVASTTQATSTGLTVTNNFIHEGLTSALVITGAGGTFAEYAGTSCTNQFVRSLSALGAATCQTVANTDLANSTISGVALGGSLAALTNDTTLNGSSYNGSAAISDWGINLGNANTWTALQQLNGQASTTKLSVYTNFYAGASATTTIDSAGNLTTGGWLKIPSAANPTVDVASKLSIDSTAASSSLRYHDGTAERAIFNTVTRSFVIASSTITGTTTLILQNSLRPMTLTSFYCKSPTGTVFIRFGDGTNWTSDLQCTSSGASKTVASNNTFIMREDFTFQIGTPATSPTLVTVSYDISNDTD